MKMRTYKNQFPDYGDMEPEILNFLIEHGFWDSSWHNDTCPSWTHDDSGLRVFIDYKEQEQSECWQNQPTSPYCRFFVYQADMDMEYNDDCPQTLTNNWQETMNFIETYIDGNQ